MSEAVNNRDLNDFQKMSLARDIVKVEARALADLSENIPVEFAEAVQLIVNCSGAIIVAGVGKAGWIGQKISASFASTGTRSHFLHPGEAMHGDLGRIGPEDVVLVFSNSGSTEEVVRLLPTLAKLGVKVIAVTGKNKSELAKQADVVLDFGSVQEACPLGLAPTTSTTLMLALGDALALVASQMIQFSTIDFAKYHPGGSIGKKLATVDEIMRPLELCRVAKATQTIREILIGDGKQGRRIGAVVLINEDQTLAGIFTDSDLARLLQNQLDSQLDEPIANAMTTSPITIASGTRMNQAIDILATRSLSELPVVDDQNRPLGMIDITDIVGILPTTKIPEQSQN